MEGLDGSGGGLAPLAGAAEDDATGGGREDFLLGGVGGELESLEGEFRGGGRNIWRDVSGG